MLTMTQTRTGFSPDGDRSPAHPRRAHRPPERRPPPDVVRATDPDVGDATGTSGTVVLWGLPALYAHGLRDALLEAGHAPVVTREGGAPPSAAPGGGRTAVVVVGSDPPAGADGLDALAGVPVVELVADAGVEAFTAAMGRGAVGVLDPGTELEHAVEVVAAAALGLVLVPDHVGEVLTSQRQRASAPEVGATERAWLRWLGAGGTVSGLAASAAYSEREMYRLLRKLYTRLEAGGRTEALLQAERWGLLDA